LEAAARVLAEHGEATTMSEVAEEAGVGRATLYRYFDNREQLVEALWSASIAEMCERLASAGLERVSVEEGIARFVRTIAIVGERYAALLTELSQVKRQEAGAAVSEPLLELFVRGQSTGVLRADLSIEHLAELFGGLIVAGLGSARELGLGVEEASAAVTDLFLRGALVAQGTH
jgi:AcrR family transcriptional regulator